MDISSLTDVGLFGMDLDAQIGKIGSHKNKAKC